MRAISVSVVRDKMHSPQSLTQTLFKDTLVLKRPKLWMLKDKLQDVFQSQDCGVCAPSLRVVVLKLVGVLLVDLKPHYSIEMLRLFEWK